MMNMKYSQKLTGLSSGAESPGLQVAAILLAQARPNTTRSSSELAPSRLAPCTETHAASPAAYNPGITWS